MTAYVIVDIDVHDPLDMRNTKNLRLLPWNYMAANTSRAAAIPKRSKAIGRRVVWSFCNLKVLSRQRSG